MHYYKLSNAAMDDSFIKGETVVCKIALHQDQTEVKAGDAIIVSLSTGAKYKGVVVQVDSLWLKQAAFGEMSVRRALPLQ
jgi:hypothetical protein